MFKIAPPKKPFNEYKICDTYAIIYLLKQTCEIFECLVDLDDLDRLIKYNRCWHTTYDPVLEQYYAKTNESYYNEFGKYKQRMLYMHKFILDYKGNKKYIDHKNHNTLDNRKDNLIIISQKSNSKNRLGANKNSKTGVRNVSWSNRDNCYLVQFQVEGKNTCFGKFKKNEFDSAVKMAEEFREKIYGKELFYLNK